MTTPAPSQDTGRLAAAEAARVQRYHDRLLAALAARDRTALRGVKQEVLQAAYATPPQGGRSAALRRALRLLAWRMAGLRLPRGASR